MRCELHNPLTHCDLEALLTVAAVHGQGLEVTAIWTASACRDHAWEATARAALRAIAHHAGDARVMVTVEEPARQILELYGLEDDAGRWPLAAVDVEG
jgi:hypothetical protein